ncbi:MAG: hypothetical protein ACP5HI_05425 [Caldimicrobium sp.]
MKNCNTKNSIKTLLHTFLSFHEESSKGEIREVIFRLKVTEYYYNYEIEPTVSA